jgi:hypothetical protein
MCINKLGFIKFSPPSRRNVMSNVSLYLILMYCMILVHMFPLFLQRNKLWKIVQMYLPCWICFSLRVLGRDFFKKTEMMIIE